MTKTMISAITALTLSTAAASANDLAFLGGLEYAVEAETFEATAGVEYGIAGITLTPMLTLNDAAGGFELAAAEVTVGYAVSDFAGVYLTVEADGDFKHTETYVGVALRF